MGRKVWLKQSRQENLIYLALWGLLFAAPMLSLYVRTAGDANAVFDWAEIFLVWRRLAVFMLLFLVHNFLLAPLLVHGQKRMTYISCVTIMLVAFTVYQCSNKPEEGSRSSSISNPKPHVEQRHVAPPPIIGEHDILAVLILVLMFATNIGIKGYFRSRDDQKRLAQLEHESLEQQLEYLRYQINPHFFMNTLNNIHALVDIDPNQAKDTIVELSKMMRYVLYEGNKQHVLLSQEFDFIRHYVALMQLRYTDKVKITLELPQEGINYKMPPLILITFIENAFKHGVSYQHESFIEIKASVADDKLQFFCRNSKSPLLTSPKREEKGGVGLANVRKRLDLLYNAYTLNIQDDADVYSVELTLPLKS